MSIGRNLKKLLAGIAPTLGTALGGPFGGVAMKFLADKFTGGDTGSVEDFLLASNPETLQKLKMAELEFKREMKKLDIDLEEIAYKDRDSARELAVKRGLLPQIILSAIYTAGYFGVMYMFMTGKISVPPESKVMFGGLLGVLSTAQIQIMNFFFGSSAGSKAKTDAMTSSAIRD